MEQLIAVATPFRYRGYYYDNETSLYYLNSRYYDSANARFINADGYINANGDLQGFNMFAYCSNNPVMFVDPNGTIVIFGIAIGGSALAYGAIAFATSVLGLAIASDDRFKKDVADAGREVGKWFKSWVKPKEKDESKVDAVPDVRVDDQDEAVYYGADAKGGIWKIHYDNPMTLKEAKLWVDQQIDLKTYGKDAIWGIYTLENKDAYKFAQLLSYPMILSLIPDEPTKNGHYYHYHPYGHVYRKANVHCWYGGPR